MTARSQATTANSFVQWVMVTVQHQTTYKIHTHVQHTHTYTHTHTHTHTNTHTHVHAGCVPEGPSLESSLLVSPSLVPSTESLSEWTGKGADHQHHQRFQQQQQQHFREGGVCIMGAQERELAFGPGLLAPLDGPWPLSYQIALFPDIVLGKVCVWHTQLRIVLSCVPRLHVFVCMQAMWWV